MPHRTRAACRVPSLSAAGTRRADEAQGRIIRNVGEKPVTRPLLQQAPVYGSDAIAHAGNFMLMKGSIGRDVATANADMGRSNAYRTMPHGWAHLAADGPRYLCRALLPQGAEFRCSSAAGERRLRRSIVHGDRAQPGLVHPAFTPAPQAA